MSWISSHSRKMTTEQARLDSKKRTITVPVQTEAGNKGKLKESDERGWFTKKNLWTILLIVAGLAVLYFTKYEEWKIPSLVPKQLALSLHPIGHSRCADQYLRQREGEEYTSFSVNRNTDYGLHCLFALFLGR